MTAVTAAWPSVTVKLPVAAPSVTAAGPASVTSTVSGEASSLIVVVTLPAPPLTTRFSKLPPVADDTLTVKVSPESARASSIVAMLKVALEAPAGIVTDAIPL